MPNTHDSSVASLVLHKSLVLRKSRGPTLMPRVAGAASGVVAHPRVIPAERLVRIQKVRVVCEGGEPARTDMVRA